MNTNVTMKSTIVNNSFPVSAIAVCIIAALAPAVLLLKRQAAKAAGTTQTVPPDSIE